MKAELVPENGDPPIPIERDVTVIGRHESCDVVIQAVGMSKRHCVVVKTDGLLVIRDLATTNGTKVKGQRVRWAALCRKTGSAWAVTRFGSIWGRTRCPRRRSSGASGAVESTAGCVRAAAPNGVGQRPTARIPRRKPASRPGMAARVPRPPRRSPSFGRRIRDHRRR